MAYDVTDFEQQVLTRSHQTPVVVDFWAPWCGPCRTLGPVLEKLDEEADGAWELAKLNTDQNQAVSARYGIRGIPAVKMFIDGQVTDEFTGALPEYAVKQWLDKALPTRAKNVLQDAEEAVILGDEVAAISLLEEVLDDEPGNPAAAALLAGLVVFSDPERARELAATGMSGEPRHVQMAEAVRVLADLLSEAESLPEGPGREVAQWALDHLRACRYDEAAEQFTVLLQKDRMFGDDLARRAGVALFTVLGPEHPVTRARRRTFDMWLY